MNLSEFISQHDAADVEMSAALESARAECDVLRTQGIVDRADAAKAVRDLAAAQQALTLADTAARADAATIARLQAEIAALKAATPPPVEPPPVVPPVDPGPVEFPNHVITHEFDLSRNDGWVLEDTKASNNDGTDRKTNVLFGVGPAKKSMRILGNRDTPGGTFYVADAKATHVPVTVPFACHIDYELDAPIPAGMWPAIPWFRPAAGSTGRGELDAWEKFQGHPEATRDRITLHRTGSDPKTGYQGANHAHVGKSLPLIPAGRGSIFFEMTADLARTTIGGKTITLTKAEFDKGAGAGSWDTLSANWYGRITLQAGGEGGPIPADLTGWGFYIHRMVYLRPA